MDFDSIWSNIIRHAGEPFYTIRGHQFAYRVEGEHVITDRKKSRIPKSDFERTSHIESLTNPGQINEAVWGPSYVYAILTDDRVKIS